MNHQWLVRQLAVMEHLSSGAETFDISSLNAEPILVSSSPLSGITTVGIDNPRERNLPEEPDEGTILDDSDEFDDTYLET
jgi:hypothetical protein